MSTRCNVCDKKLKNIFVEITGKCRCGNVFCKEHIINHNCTFDYKQLYVTEKKDELIIVKKDKVIKI
tara:strand:- start:148 stop:348 length:201 start_codon:yes stop_codon:yes gene_type:complete